MLEKIRGIFSVFKERKEKSEAINSFIKELQKVLISSDVEIKTVIQISNLVKEKIEKEYIPGVDLELLAKKVLVDVLIDILGKEGGKLNISSRPSFILLVGLYGHGKTTSAVKLAKYLRERGYSVACLCLDVHRPAAYEQLLQLCQKASIDFYGDKNEKDPIKIIEKFYDKLKKYKVVIVDTAGRDDLTPELIHEIKLIKEKLRPDEILLVIDAGIGRVAKRISESFSKEIGITGIIITKMDSSAKAGGALVAAISSGAKVKFIGTGEHLDDFEPFDPKSYIKRLIGIGDIEGLYRQIDSIVRKLKKEEKELEESAMRILEGKMTLKDFYLYIKSILVESPFDKLVSFLPGFGMDEKIMGIAKDKLKKYLVILQSFRESELLDHTKVIKNKKRLKKIAIGAGVKEEDVINLINDFNRIKNQMLYLLKNRELRMRGPLGRMFNKFMRGGV